MIFRWRNKTDRKLDFIIRLLWDRRHKEMANWADIKADIDGLKAEMAKVYDVMMAVKAKLKDAMDKPTIDPADLQAVHDDMVNAVVDMESKLHSDGM